jgi:Holliday junction resolvasome RuvABC endonuclease subunit
VGRLVGALLGLKEPPEEDAADALAVAITHIQATRSKGIAR